MNIPNLELVSFHLCPYVQRSIITLKLKKVPYTFNEVDLENPPEWFLKISPAGRVPVLVVDGKTSIFESAVINEYIDEITEPHLTATEPLQRAKERAWIAYAGEVFMEFYMLSREPDAGAAEKGLLELMDSICKVEDVLGAGPYFRGKDFSLVDAAFAPFFIRFSFIARLWEHHAWKSMPKTRAWATALLAHPAVKESTAPDLKEGMLEYMKELGGHLV